MRLIFSPSARVDTSSVPTSEGSAPYLRAFAASSWTAIARLVAAASPTRIRSTATRVRPLKAPQG
jgi:hypothetical protein